MSSLTIEMLPAREGDCLLLTYDDKGKPRRVLIDGGRKATYKTLKARLEALPKQEREIELFVITHVDRDHIEGALEVLEDPKCPVTFRDIWFNGYAHLKDPDGKKQGFGAVQGERMTKALLQRAGQWNAAFKRKAAYVANKPITKKLRGGLELTVLSPDAAKLAAMEPVWAKECAKAGLVPNKKGPKPPPGVEGFGVLNIDALAAQAFVDDHAEANGTSIGLLAEYKKARVLLAADCHVDRMMASLKSLAPGKKKLALSAFKVAHHGSEHNVSQELLEKLDCERYLISSNGSYFKHPTRSAVARIVKHGGKSKQLYFNYRTKFTQIWDSAALMQKHGYDVTFPSSTKDNGNLTVVIPA